MNLRVFPHFMNSWIIFHVIGSNNPRSFEKILKKSSSELVYLLNVIPSTTDKSNVVILLPASFPAGLKRKWNFGIFSKVSQKLKIFSKLLTKRNKNGWNFCSICIRLVFGDPPPILDKFFGSWSQPTRIKMRFFNLSIWPKGFQDVVFTIIKRILSRIVSTHFYYVILENKIIKTNWRGQISTWSKLSDRPTRLLDRTQKPTS